MKILSLFDGMACGALAMQAAGYEIERYVAYEIDKYAISVASHNFPFIEQCGDVFKADFTQYEGNIDIVMGGSPCTYWSIAQKNNRETEASGLGWELFSQYVRAVKEAKPKYFIYENNKSMSKAIRSSIDETFGFEAIGINSALVSAQNRQRLYWVGKRNEDGTYSKAKVEQPEDRGILLRDILESGMPCRNEKAYCLDANYYKGGNLTSYNKQSGMRLQVEEPVAGRIVGRRINEDGHRDDYNENLQHIQRYEENDNPQKTNCVTTVTKDNMIAVPIHNNVELVPFVEKKISSIIDKYGYLPKMFNAYNTSEITDKHPTLTTQAGSQTNSSSVFIIEEIDNMIAQPVVFPVKEATKKGFTEIQPYDCVDLTQPNSKTRRGRNMKDKSNCLTTSNEFYQYMGTVKMPIYEVKDGLITIKDKHYPIKLVDGFYIIRKLTVKECMRLQTVPEWYDFSVISNSQAYKCLGNGWTVEVIAHLLKSLT